MAPGRLPNPMAEAESLARAIANIAADLDPVDRAKLYRYLAEIVTRRRDELEADIRGDDPVTN